jgi:hypothetical protein
MRRITWKKYAGLLCKGTHTVGLEGKQGHLRNAAWLTAQVECGGKYGSVMNYDGTGMTAGIHQAIAVYPRELAQEDFNARDDQGPLFKLLARIDAARVARDEMRSLRRLFISNDCYLAADGRLRLCDSGKLVPGRRIREILTGASNGCMPVRGKHRARATEFVRAFSMLFSHPDTFSIQDCYGMEHFIKRAERIKLRFCKKSTNRHLTIQDAVYSPYGVHIAAAYGGDNIPDELDLAMSIFWSFTVNAPGAALKLFCRVYDKSTQETLPANLIKALGKSRFGRWSADKKNGRYQRTRRAAIKVWPSVVVNKVMPKSF